MLPAIKFFTLSINTLKNFFPKEDIIKSIKCAQFANFKRSIYD